MKLWCCPYVGKELPEEGIRFIASPLGEKTMEEHKSEDKNKNMQSCVVTELLS